MIERKNRIEVIDALRGFAIFGIMLLHFSNHFLYGHHPESDSEFISSLNENLKSVLYFLLEGKAYAIFALLFGFTFGLQFYKSFEKGKDFRARFLWRMVGLVAFGYLNAAFFPGGDPLVFMAIIAVVLPLIAKLDTKLLLVIAFICFIQPIEFYQFINLWLNPDFELPKKFTGKLYAQLQPAVESGDLFQMLWVNITTGLQACLVWAFEFGRWSQTAGLYIVGFLFYRHQYFQNAKSSFWIRLLLWSLLITPVLYVFKESISLYDAPLKRPLSIILKMWYNLSFLFVLMSLFVILFQSEIVRNRLKPLRYYGIMSLTNFVSQSIIGSFIFFPYGLNLAEKSNIMVSVLIALLVGFSQIMFSKWWLSKYKRGPFEYLWHRFTYLF